MLHEAKREELSNREPTEFDHLYVTLDSNHPAIITARKFGYLSGTNCIRIGNILDAFSRQKSSSSLSSVELHKFTAQILIVVINISIGDVKKIIEYILKNFGAEDKRKIVNLRDTFEDTLLKEPRTAAYGVSSTTVFVQAAFRLWGEKDTLGYLVSIGADVNLADGDGFTALMLAAKKGSIEAVDYLLNLSETNVNQTNNNGDTALTLAKTLDGELGKDLLYKGQRRDLIGKIEAVLSRTRKTSGKSTNPPASILVHRQVRTVTSEISSSTTSAGGVSEKLIVTPGTEKNKKLWSDEPIEDDDDNVEAKEAEVSKFARWKPFGKPSSEAVLVGASISRKFGAGSSAAMSETAEDKMVPVGSKAAAATGDKRERFSGTWNDRVAATLKAVMGEAVPGDPRKKSDSLSQPAVKTAVRKDAAESENRKFFPSQFNVKSPSPRGR